AAKSRWEYKPEDIWEFQPLTHPKIPETKKQKHSTAQTNPIDAFISEKLEDKGLRPAPPADRPILIRRVTYDLTGLPPTPEEVDAFVKDKSSQGFENVIDYLLKSPQYGAHW